MNQKILISQAVHGYASGHRLLALSREIANSDSKTMMVLSDASGPDVVIPAGGYLTGYPLYSTGSYALARTWAAPEVERRGSVWTHTLLIDFADLSFLPDMYSLLKFFQRPTPATFSEFQKPLYLEISSKSNETITSSMKEEKLRKIVWSLYSFPDDSITAFTDPSAEFLALSIWKQQWPRLRRNFRFCTLAFADRSSSGATFDLQFIPYGDKKLRNAVAPALFAEDQEPISRKWLEDSVSDILKFGRTEFQEYLRSAGVDLSEGRSAFIPLCEFFPLLRHLQGSVIATNMAVAQIQAQNIASNVLLTAITSAAVKNVSLVDTNTFVFTLKHIESVPREIFSAHSKSIGIRIWKEKPEEISELITQYEPLTDAIQQAISEIEIEKLCDTLNRHQDLVELVVKSRPKILCERLFWQSVGEGAELALQTSIDNAIEHDTVCAIIEADRIDLAEKALLAFGAKTILSAIRRLQGKLFRRQLERWIEACITEQTEVASYLSQKDVCFEIMYFIASKVSPDYPLIETGKDPWLIAKKNTRTDWKKENSVLMFAFLFARGLGDSTTQKDQLLIESFDQLYAYAENGKLINYPWELLSSRLPKISWYRDWDKCERLRLAIIFGIGDESINSSSLGKITKKISILKELVKGIKQFPHGKYILKKSFENMTLAQKKAIKPLI